MEEFRRFKDVLIQAPQERERWFRFQEERVKGRLRAGWQQNGIEALEGPSSTQLGDWASRPSV